VFHRFAIYLCTVPPLKIRCFPCPPIPKPILALTILPTDLLSLSSTHRHSLVVRSTSFPLRTRYTLSTFAFLKIYQRTVSFYYLTSPRTSFLYPFPPSIISSHCFLHSSSTLRTHRPDFLQLAFLHCTGFDSHSRNVTTRHEVDTDSAHLTTLRQVDHSNSVRGNAVWPNDPCPRTKTFYCVPSPYPA